MAGPHLSQDEPQVGDAEVHRLDAPYFTNHVWLARTLEYSKVLRNRSYFIIRNRSLSVFDGFDEVPMNRHFISRRSSKPLCVMPNAFALHPAYTSVPFRTPRTMAEKQRFIATATAKVTELLGLNFTEPPEASQSR